MLEPERPVSPPDVPDREFFCPVCQMPARKIYRDYNYNIFGCDMCVKSDLIDDMLDIPENEPLPECNYCKKQEQTVYVDKDGEIRACAECVGIQDPERADL